MVSARFYQRWLGILVILLACGLSSADPIQGDSSAQSITYYWTALIPQNDPRDEEQRSFDEFDSQSWVDGMNQTEAIFHHHLIWNKVAIKDLLSFRTPFCELPFDAVKSLTLTDKEKSIVVEYLRRGGFIYLREDAYPYFESQYWNIKSWTILDFFTKDLPASDHNFVTQTITNDHPMNTFIYDTSKTTDTLLPDGPYSPDNVLVTYHGRPSVFVYVRLGYYVNNSWLPVGKPYPHTFCIDAPSYQTTINNYVYVTQH
jgi:hypothetical protein